MAEEVQDLEALDPEEWVTIFVGDMDSARERKKALNEEDIPCRLTDEIEGYEAAPGAPVVLALQAQRQDIPDIALIFEAIWQDTLNHLGVQVEEHIIDFSQDTIICPGCHSEISEVTEEGECIECGLFLGLPPEEDEDDVEQQDGA